MTEIEKIAYAKSFIDKLANGINPLDDTAVPDNELINNIRISRCFFYVSDILQKHIEQEEAEAKKALGKQARAPFSLTVEQLQNFEYSHEPISVALFVKKINSLAKAQIDKKIMERFSRRDIYNWLSPLGLIEWKEWTNGKMKCFPTADGEALGIGLVIWKKYRNKSPVLIFSEDAQRFIIDNFNSILERKTNQAPILENETSEEDT